VAAGFVVLLRETLEATLVVAVVMAYLRRAGEQRQMLLVLWAVAAGVAGSIGGALIFQRVAGGFDGTGEQIFEGAVMAAAALLLTTMIIWVTRRSSLEHSIERSMSRAGRGGLFVLVFLSILREGVETVLFLGAAAANAQGSIIAGALGGMAVALTVGAFLMLGSRRMRLRRFFTVTNVLLILFAAGLVAQSFHEFQEAGVLPGSTGPLWNFNPPPLADGSLPPLHEDGLVGSFAKSMFGYDGDPSLLEVAAYAVYLVAALGTWLTVSSRRRRADAGTAPA